MVTKKLPLTLDAINAEIDHLSLAEQARVRYVACLFRAMLNEYSDGVVALAMTLVVAESSSSQT